VSVSGLWCECDCFCFCVLCVCVCVCVCVCAVLELSSLMLVARFGGKEIVSVYYIHVVLYSLLCQLYVGGKKCTLALHRNTVSVSNNYMMYFIFI